MGVAESIHHNVLLLPNLGGLGHFRVLVEDEG